MSDPAKLDGALNLFAGTKGGNLEGKISIDEFLQYHRELAMTIPNDEYFARAIESTFKSVQEAGDASIKMNNVMQVIKLMRQRLLTISNNGQEEYVLRNIFRTFDTDKSGYITLNELAGMLAHLQVYVEDNCLQAVMRELLPVCTEIT